MSCRTEGGLSERVWEAIDQATDAVKAANCTARRFLEVDGPYGFGLTSVAGNEQLIQPSQRGASYQNWNVARLQGLSYGAPPRVKEEGTYMVTGSSRAVPLIASEFSLSMRAIAAFEAGCQPLDLCPATRAARDVALEEERLVYYGYHDDKNALLTIGTWNGGTNDNATLIQYGRVFDGVRKALYSLTRRGYAGPFALAAEPVLYGELYSPVVGLATTTPATPVLLVDLLRAVFRGGIYLAPVIDSASVNPDVKDPKDKDYYYDRYHRAGAIVTVGRGYSRLIVGQDWYTAYRGRSGVLHNFLLLSSLQLRICDPRSIEVLMFDYTDKTPPEEDIKTAIKLLNEETERPADDEDVRPIPDYP